LNDIEGKCPPREKRKKRKGGRPLTLKAGRRGGAVTSLLKKETPFRGEKRPKKKTPRLVGVPSVNANLSEKEGGGKKVFEYYDRWWGGRGGEGPICQKGKSLNNIKKSRLKKDPSFP